MFKIKINDEALQDIQEATYWYNNILKGLGTRFQKQVLSQIDALKSSAQYNGSRYDDVRCMQIYKFPFLVHYRLEKENQLVEIFAVFHTSRNPEIWSTRN